MDVMVMEREHNNKLSIAQVNDLIDSTLYMLGSKYEEIMQAEMSEDTQAEIHRSIAKIIQDQFGNPEKEIA